MLQKERKSGHWQVERLQFLKREQRGLRLRYAVIDLQPGDLQTAKFSCLLHHKGSQIFQIKRPLFWKNARICHFLMTNRVVKNFLSKYSEMTWCEVVKCATILGILALHHHSLDGESSQMDGQGAEFFSV